MPEKFRHFPLLATISFFLLGIFFTIPALKSLGYQRTFFFLGLNKLTGLLFCLFFFRGADKSSYFFQKVCSLRGVFDCKKVIQSPAGKLFGISLIEWGIIYFYSGILLLFLGIHSKSLPAFENLNSLMTIAALTYSCYLLIYQIVYLRKICLLCLVVQLCIWAEFFVLLKSFGFTLGWIPGYFLTIFMLCLITGFLTWKAVRYCIYLFRDFERNEIELLKIRRNPDYIKFILSEAEKDDIGRFSTELAYGGDEASVTILLVLHPFCKPCQDTFNQFIKLIRQGSGKVKGVIRIITGTKESKGLDSEVGRIVFYYLVADGARASLEVLNDWFCLESSRKEFDKNRVKWLQKQYPCINNDLIAKAEKIMNAQREWAASLPIEATPVIFFDECRLPRNIQLSDLTYYIFNEI